MASWGVVVLLTVASCTAFLLLPLVAAQGVEIGPKAQWLFLTLTVVWSVTSSALRAPPLVLLGKYANVAAIPWLASLSFLGIGIAGAMALLGMARQLRGQSRTVSA